ncbi:LOW QUALITY PROTEIN: docking protein 3 [Egretta garzetta]|uniref:LOW QUALITY PROTEIN: docking protein 3 n=1 Tax=Egretta garzetta TaxID=188379 RepID=UPI00163C4093|nr:LOW QUALITY PROTEIN: docking protein 3 [Egretta garzetta]
MERPVKDGILYVQHCKFGKRSWRKMRAQLFAASPSGVARMEKFDVRDDGTALEKNSLRRCARRVIRLSDCVSVGPAGIESCPKATAAFYLTTTEKSYVLAAEQRDEWIAQLCQLAFQGAKDTVQSSARNQPSLAIPMEENSLYSSWQDLTEFLVLVVQTDASTRCGLHGHYLLSALPQSLVLKDPQSRQPLLTWPYPFLRKFGQDQTIFSFEARRTEATGPIVYASIARGQQPLFGPGQLGPNEPWTPGKPLPEHLYENIFTTEPGPAGTEEEEEEEEGQWELGCRQGPPGHSSGAAASPRSETVSAFSSVSFWGAVRESGSRRHSAAGGSGAVPGSLIRVSISLSPLALTLLEEMLIDLGCVSNHTVRMVRVELLLEV